MDKIKHRGSLTLLLITAVLGIPYIVYTYFIFENLGHLALDTALFITVSILAWILGSRYDREFHAKQKLLNKQTEMNKIFDHAEAMLWSNDLVSKRLTISKGAEMIFGISNEELAQEHDYWLQLTHPEDSEKVYKFYDTLLQGKEASEDWRLVIPNEGVKWIHCSGSPTFDDKGEVVSLVGVLTDITEHKQLEEKSRYLANHDSLTDLPNRRFLYEYMKKELNRAKGYGSELSIMYMDLDGFKEVNDRFGHEAGDYILSEVAKKINGIIRENDFAARIGGDEYVVVLENVSKKECREITERIISKIREPYYYYGNRIDSLTISIGISRYPKDGEDGNRLINNADKALSLAKARGKNNAQFY